MSSYGIVVLSDIAMTYMDVSRTYGSEMIVSQHPLGSLLPKIPT